jgi:hypothetical protein
MRSVGAFFAPRQIIRSGGTLYNRYAEGALIFKF